MKWPLLITFCGFSFSVEGAIVYREIIPSEILDISGLSLINNIDLDRDGSNEFTTNGSSGEARLIPTMGNRVLARSAVLPDLGQSAVAVGRDFSIGANPLGGLNWFGLEDRVNASDDGGSSLYMCDGRGPVGEPPVCVTSLNLTVNSFVGLEFQIQGETHYGWMEIIPIFDSNQHHTRIAAWAYEDQPNTSILAGAIPEPSSILLVITGLATLLRRHR